MNNQHFSVAPSQITSDVTNLDDFVVIGLKGGQPWVASTKDKTETRNFIREYAGDLLPQLA